MEERRLLAVGVVSSAQTPIAPKVDDIAIWIHPTDASKSVIIGTVKSSATSSVRVYDLAGAQLQAIDSSRVNNVDLRYNFRLSNHSTAIVAGSNRSSNSLVLYRVDPETGLLTDVAARTISIGTGVDGCAMYVSPASGKYYVFVTSDSGQAQQWELIDNGADKVDAQLVRSFSVGSNAEGMVADDVLGYLYVSEEDVGIWRYSAEPDGGTTRTLIDNTGVGAHLTADVEGLTIYYAPSGVGYLLASSQGSSEFAVYERATPNSYVGSFKLVAGNGINAVTNTDGIDVTNVPLGSTFPHGLFVAQDNDNNFKLVRWDAIATALGGLVHSNTTWDPRDVGLQSSALLGDYNVNGDVDAADYTVWRKTLSAIVPAFSGADGSGNGVVDQTDYDVWRAYFGHPVSASGANLEAVTAIEDEPMFTSSDAVTASYIGSAADDQPTIARNVKQVNIAPYNATFRWQDWHNRSRGLLDRFNVAEFAGDELLVLAFDRAVNSQPRLKSLSDNLRHALETLDPVAEGAQEPNPLSALLQAEFGFYGYNSKMI